MTTYNEAAQTYEDTDFVYDGMLSTVNLSVLIGKRTAWRDFTDLFNMSSASITDAGTNARSTASFQVRTTLADAPEIKDQSLVAFVPPGTGPDVFRGIVRSRRPRSGMKTMLDIIADDLGGLLDDTFIPFESRPAETMVVRITDLWQIYGSPPLDLDNLSFVAAIGGTLLAQNFAGVTLRQAIEATINQVTGADYYVDIMGRLHIFTSETNNAPYAVKVGTPAGGEIAPEDLDIDYDSNVYANRVYVQGATPAGSGFFSDATAITALDGMVRTRVLQAPDCETSAMASSLASMYLGRVAGAKPRGSFTASSPYDGWRAGQNVTVTESDMGIAAQVFRIANVTTTFRGKPTGFEREYVVQFGGGSAGARGVQSEGIGTGQLVSGNLGGGSNAYINGDGMQITDLTRVRLYAGKLPNGDYGLQVVNGDDVTIIDGSSDIFSIVATGTLNITGCDGDPTACETNTNVDLATGLTYAPAHVCFVETGSSAFSFPYVDFLTADGTMSEHRRSSTSVVNTNQTRVSIKWVANLDLSALTRTVRFNVLKQVAF